MKDVGGTPIYQQMESDLLQRDRKLSDSRKGLLEDLHKFLDRETKTGSTIFLMGDMNDNLGLSKGQVRTFLASAGMKMTYVVRHGMDSTLLATHDRGSTCIDLIGCSSNVPTDTIVPAGYEPFYFNLFTDHGGVYVDLDIDSIFSYARPDTTRQIYKRFTTRHVPKCSKYLGKLEELLEKSRIFQEVNELERRYQKNEKEKSKDEEKKIIRHTDMSVKIRLVNV